MESTTQDIVTRAIAAVGGPVAMATALTSSGKRISSQAIGQWRRVPAERVLEVEALTGLSRYDLRPDVYGERRDTSSEAAHA